MRGWCQPCLAKGMRTSFMGLGTLLLTACGAHASTTAASATIHSATIHSTLAPTGAALERNGVPSGPKVAALERNSVRSGPKVAALERNSAPSGPKVAALERNGVPSGPKVVALESKGGWMRVEMPDGSSVEDYAVGHDLPEMAAASIYVVSRAPTDRPDGRADLTVSISSDLGRTFLKLATIRDASVGAHVFVAPSDDRTVLITTGGPASGMSETDAPTMLWRSTDGGMTFTPSTAPDAIDTDPAQASRLPDPACRGLRRTDLPAHLDGAASGPAGPAPELAAAGGSFAAPLEALRCAPLTQSSTNGAPVVGVLGITPAAHGAPRALALTLLRPQP